MPCHSMPFQANPFSSSFERSKLLSGFHGIVVHTLTPSGYEMSYLSIERSRSLQYGLLVTWKRIKYKCYSLRVCMEMSSFCFAFLFLFPSLLACVWFACILYQIGTETTNSEHPLLTKERKGKDLDLGIPVNL